MNPDRLEKLTPDKLEKLKQLFEESFDSLQLNTKRAARRWLHDLEEFYRTVSIGPRDRWIGPKIRDEVYLLTQFDLPYLRAQLQVSGDGWRDSCIIALARHGSISLLLARSTKHGLRFDTAVEESAAPHRAGWKPINDFLVKGGIHRRDIARKAVEAGLGKRHTVNRLLRALRSSAVKTRR